MKLSILATLVSCSYVAFGATMQKRDANTIINDINQISTQLAKVYSDVQAFQGGSSATGAALAIYLDSQNLSNKLKQAGTDAANTAALSSSDSATIASMVTALQPSIYATLDLLTAKHDGFKTAALGFSAISLVESSLQSLQQGTDTFAANLVKKFVPVLAGLSPLVSGQIDFHYIRAEQAFNQ